MGGQYDSSKTRVGPVFDRLAKTVEDWLPKLLQLPEYGAEDSESFENLDLSIIEKAWEPCEKKLPPPPALLSWLVENPQEWNTAPDKLKRELLAKGDPETVKEALHKISVSYSGRDWYILEGQSSPDVYIDTKDALIVIEGKRTESGPTTSTKWMSHRHQMWRHIDGAWEIRGRRKVFGFFIVESEDGSVPAKWKDTAEETLSESVMKGSFPHRSAEEIKRIRKCFIGVTTWQKVCYSFGISMNDLPDTV